MDKLFLSVAQTAHVLGLGRTKIYELIRDGRLQAVKVGRRRLVKVDSLHEIGDDNFSAARPVGPDA